MGLVFPPTVDRALIGMQLPQIPSALCGLRKKVITNESHGVLYGDVAVHVWQQPSETVHVPTGWPHSVLNLQPSSVAFLTENYATPFPNWTRFWQAVQERVSRLGDCLAPGRGKTWTRIGGGGRVAGNGSYGSWRQGGKEGGPTTTGRSVVAASTL